MKKFPLKTFALVATILSKTAMGDIVLLNDPTLPPSADGFNITRDTSTSFEWLDLDVSVGRTFNDLTGLDGSNEFAPGGDFEGFRYATHEQLTGAFNGPQLDSLYKSLGISPFGFSSIGGYPSARAVITIAGCFGSCDAHGYSYGILLADNGVTESEASMEAFRTQGFNWGRSAPSSPPALFNPNDDFPLQRGNWLIRDIPAPDADGDGISDTVDNCTLVANTAQIDTNGDGIGNRCDFDYNGDCNVNFLDFTQFPPAFNTALGDPAYDEDLDFDSDGIINFTELFGFTAYFNGPPGPSANPCVP